jgi:hypothetical protein
METWKLNQFDKVIKNVGNNEVFWGKRENSGMEKRFLSSHEEKKFESISTLVVFLDDSSISVVSFVVSSASFEFEIEISPWLCGISFIQNQLSSEWTQNLF